MAGRMYIDETIDPDREYSPPGLRRRRRSAGTAAAVAAAAGDTGRIASTLTPKELDDARASLDPSHPDNMIRRFASPNPMIGDKERDTSAMLRRGRQIADVQSGVATPTYDRDGRVLWTNPGPAPSPQDYWSQFAGAGDPALQQSLGLRSPERRPPEADSGDSLAGDERVLRRHRQAAIDMALADADPREDERILRRRGDENHQRAVRAYRNEAVEAAQREQSPQGQQRTAVLRRGKMSPAYRAEFDELKRVERAEGLRRERYAHEESVARYEAEAKRPAAPAISADDRELFDIEDSINSVLSRYRQQHVTVPGAFRQAGTSKWESPPMSDVDQQRLNELQKRKEGILARRVGSGGVTRGAPGAPGAPGGRAASEADIAASMRQTGLSREEVIRRLKAKGFTIAGS